MVFMGRYTKAAAIFEGKSVEYLSEFTFVTTYISRCQITDQDSEIPYRRIPALCIQREGTSLLRWRKDVPSRCMHEALISYKANERKYKG